MREKLRQHLTNLGLAIAAISFALSYVLYVKKALAVGYSSGRIAALTLVTVGSLVILFGLHSKTKREEKIGPLYVRILIAFVLFSISVFFDHIERLL
jgi:hypothetical protein